VRRALFEAVACYAGAHKVPVAIHLAETLEESELLKQHTGPFIEFLRDLGAWDPDGLVAGSDELQDLFRQVSPILMVHGNHLPQTWREESSHAVCPRTHAAFGRRPLPLDLATALGTDSLASNPDLDILAEARFVYPSVRPQRQGPARLLHSLTNGGASALGWHRETGTLTPGKSADLVVLPLPSRDAADPHDLIFDSDLPVEAVMFLGQWSPIDTPSQWPDKGIRLD
jgi:aminodeoxyfutalosine deaminase